MMKSNFEEMPFFDIGSTNSSLRVSFPYYNIAAIVTPLLCT